MRCSLTLCENDVVHNMMSNALLLITQQRHRRKNSKQPHRSTVCVRVLYGGLCNSMCVCILQKINAGSSAGKVNWAFCWVKAYSVQTKGPIKKKKKKKSLLLAAQWKAKHWATVPSSQSQIIGMDDHKRWLQANPRHPSWVRSFPLRLARRHWKAAPELHRRRLAATQSAHTLTLSYIKLLSGMIFYQQRGKCQLPILM